MNMQNDSKQPCSLDLSSNGKSRCMQVTRLPEVEEEWPIIKERAEEVWTSEVTLEPESRTVPELTTTFVSQEVPRIVHTTEQVRKPETVSRTVMVEQVCRIAVTLTSCHVTFFRDSTYFL